MKRKNSQTKYQRQQKLKLIARHKALTLLEGLKVLLIDIKDHLTEK